MSLLTEALKEEIKPLLFSEYNGSYSALLNAGSYQNDIADEVFEQKGIELGGYGWDAVAALYIDEQLPQHKEALNHDSEADMLCLYSNDEQAVYDFLKGFKSYCDDGDRLRDLIDRADFEAWD